MVLDIVVTKKGGDIMAMETLVKKTLVVAFAEGIDENGDPIVKRYSYNSVKETAAPDELKQAAIAIANLYNGSLNEVITHDTNMVL